MNARKITKQLWCMLWHQKQWRKYAVSIEPYVVLEVCSKCGESFVKRRGFKTAQDTEREIDNALRIKLP